MRREGKVTKSVNDCSVRSTGPCQGNVFFPVQGMAIDRNNSSPGDLSASAQTPEFASEPHGLKEDTTAFARIKSLFNLLE